jgi:hypothetical protein
MLNASTEDREEIFGHIVVGADNIRPLVNQPLIIRLTVARLSIVRGMNGRIISSINGRIISAPTVTVENLGLRHHFLDIDLEFFALLLHNMAYLP